MAHTGASSMTPRGAGRWESGHLVLGRYAVESLLGSGGMGEVYRARDKRMARTVALKVMRLPRDSAQEQRFLARFDREAEIITRICDEHANVPFIFDRGVDDDRYVIVMEHLEGRDLAALIHHMGRLEIHDALGVAIGICKPLAIAHRRKVIHRDVKPANVFLCSGVLPAGKAPVRLMDFGVSLSRESSTITDEHATVGTPLYIAPEAFRAARDADARVDIYAVGVVLWEMLAGAHPFLIDREEMPDAAQLFAIHAAVGIPSILDVRDDVSPGLASALACAVARDPRDRWPTIEAFLGELQKELALILERAKERGTKLRTIFDRSAEPPPPSSRGVTPARGSAGTPRGPLAIVRVDNDQSAALAYKRTEKVEAVPDDHAVFSRMFGGAAVTVQPPAVQPARGDGPTTQRLVPGGAARSPAASPAAEAKTPARAPAGAAAGHSAGSPRDAAPPAAAPAWDKDAWERKFDAIAAMMARSTSEPGKREKLEAGLEDHDPEIRRICAQMLEDFGDRHSCLRITRRMPLERDASVQQALRQARAQILKRHPDPIDTQWIDSEQRKQLLDAAPAAPAATSLAPGARPPRRPADAGPRDARRPLPTPALVLLGLAAGIALFCVYVAAVFATSGRAPWAPSHDAGSPDTKVIGTPTRVAP